MSAVHWMADATRDESDFGRLGRTRRYTGEWDDNAPWGTSDPLDPFDPVPDPTKTRSADHELRLARKREQNLKDRVQQLEIENRQLRHAKRQLESKITDRTDGDADGPVVVVPESLIERLLAMPNNRMRIHLCGEFGFNYIPEPPA